MVYNDTEIILKDGRKALFRSPCEDDAEEMLRFITKASGETDFLLKYPEEYSDFTLEQEKEFLRGNHDNPNGMMIACLVDGKIAGNCQIAFRPPDRTGLYRREQPCKGFIRENGVPYHRRKTGCHTDERRFFCE